MDDAIVTATSLLREVDPVVRFFRSLVQFLIFSGVAVVLVLVPQDWLLYLSTILIGSNLLLISVYAEEAIVKWKEKATTN